MAGKKAKSTKKVARKPAVKAAKKSAPKQRAAAAASVKKPVLKVGKAPLEKN